MTEKFYEKSITNTKLKRLSLSLPLPPSLSPPPPPIHFFLILKEMIFLHQ